MFRFQLYCGSVFRAKNSPIDWDLPGDCIVWRSRRRVECYANDWLYLVTVAWESLSKIIYFYNLHRRKQAAPAVPNAPPVIKKPTVVR